MATFTWDGEAFDLVERPLVGEMRALTRWLGDDPDGLDSIVGTVAISIKRRRPTFDLRSVDAWEAEDLKAITDQLQDIADTEPDPADAPAGEPAEADPYEGIPDSDVPPTSDGSAQPAPPTELVTAAG